MDENYNQNYYYYGNIANPNYGIHQNFNYPFVDPFYAMSSQASRQHSNPAVEAILSTLTVTRIVKKSHKIETIDIASTSEDEDEDEDGNNDTKYDVTQGQIFGSESEQSVPLALTAVPDRVLAPYPEPEPDPEPEPEPEPASLQRKLSLPQAAAVAKNKTKSAIPASVIVTNVQAHHRNSATSFSSTVSTSSHDQFQRQNQSQGHIFYRTSKKIKKETENTTSGNFQNLNSESNPASKLGPSPSTPSSEFTSYNPKIWWPKMNLEKFRVPSKKVVKLPTPTSTVTRTRTSSDDPTPPKIDDEHHHGQAPAPKMANSTSAVVVSNKFGGMYECPICSKMCTTAKSLKNHMLVHDKMFRLRYACDVCPQRYSKFRPLESHLKTKHGRDYLCSGCQNSFENEADYTQHCAPLQIQVVIENGSNIATSAVRNQVQCSKCFKPFPNQCQLNKHAKTHVDMVQEKETEIAVPSKVLETIDIDDMDVDQDRDSNSNSTSSSSKNPAGENNLEIQKVPLIDLYPEYPCHHCEKIFDRETFLSEHLRMQHKGWGWSCSLCSENFESSFRIKAHLREAHSIMAAQFKDFAMSLNPVKRKCRKRRGERDKGSVEEDESGKESAIIIPNNNKKRKIRRNRKNQNGEISNTSTTTTTTTATSQNSNQEDKEVNASGSGSGSGRALFKCELCQPNKYYKMFSGLKSHYSKLHSDVIVNDVDLRLRV